MEEENQGKEKETEEEEEEDEIIGCDDGSCRTRWQLYQ